jgi:hypothetical protein
LFSCLPEVKSPMAQVEPLRKRLVFFVFARTLSFHACSSGCSQLLVLLLELLNFCPMLSLCPESYSLGCLVWQIRCLSDTMFVRSGPVSSENCWILNALLSLDLFLVDPVATPRNNGHSPEESTGAGGLSAKAQAIHHSTPKNIPNRDQQMSSVVLQY